MSSRSPSPGQRQYFHQDRRNVRKSISLSPIRTESGANLRTANWTKMRFRAPGDSRGGYHQNNWNRGNYHNNYRPYGNPRGRWINRGNYRGNNYRGNWRGGYVPKRRTYSRGYGSNSRSRSRSYSRSRSRSYSGERHYSYSRSRSRSRRRYSSSRSRSPDRRDVETKVNRDEGNPNTKSESMGFYHQEAQSSKKSDPIKQSFGKWGSPQRAENPAEKPVPTFASYKTKQQDSQDKPGFKPAMQFKSFPDLSRGDQFEDKDDAPPANEVQQMMEKTALASVARHEKSLMKIKKAQGKIKMQEKSESSDGEIEDETEMMMLLATKNAKKAKKKKSKSKLSKKIAKAKLKKLKMAAASSSSDSDEKSSDNGSDSSVEVLKKKASRKKKLSKMKQGSLSPLMKKMRNDDDGQQRKEFEPSQSNPQFVQQPMGQAPNQPMMVMAPGFMGHSGQPMGMIQLAVPGPDGQLQLIQIPQMAGRDGQQAPIVMLPQAVQSQSGNVVPTSFASTTPQPVPAPKPVPPPSEEGIKEVEMEEAGMRDEEEAEKSSKDFNEKQKHRKELARTRLWPRPANTNWAEKGEKQGLKEEQDRENEKQEIDSWAKPSKSKDCIPGFEYVGSQNDTKDKQYDNSNKNHPKNSGNQGKQDSKGSFKDEIDELPRRKQDISQTDDSLKVPQSQNTYQPELVAYPTHITQHSYEYVGKQSTQQEAGQGEGSRSKEKWKAATDVFMQQPTRQGSKKKEYIEPESSSDDDFTKAIRAKYQSEEYRKSKKYDVDQMQLEEEAQEEEIKKMSKKKKKNKKERKESLGPDESPVLKEKKRKKKKKNKDKDLDLGSDQESRRSKKKRNYEDLDDDELIRGIPQDLPLSHIRGLMMRKGAEGDSCIFQRVDFDKLSSLKGYYDVDAQDSYEDQFVSLFSGGAAEEKPARLDVSSMSKKSLRKVKITPQGPRSVSHMTSLSLSERIASVAEKLRNEEKQKSHKQKVSVNLANISTLEEKFDKPASRSRSATPERQVDRSRSRRSSSNDSASSRSRSRSRSHSRSLPKAYSGDGSYEDDRRGFRSNRGYYNYHNRYQNQRYNYRGRGFNPNYRGRGRFFRGGYNNRGGYNPNYRGRGGYNHNNYYNNNNNYYNNNRDQNQWRNRRQSYRSDEEERRERRRSRSYSSDRQSFSSRSSEGEIREHRGKMEQTSYPDAQFNKGPQQQNHPSHLPYEGNQDQDQAGLNPKVRRKSPDQWTHDMFEEHEKGEQE